MTDDTVRREIVTALRQGTVPPRGLRLFATGLDALVDQVRSELSDAGQGRGGSKWLRGDYGSGKTFTARHLATVAREAGFATAEVQVSSTDTPLHKLETVYRRLIERLETATEAPSALRSIVDIWLYEIGDKVERLRGLSETDPGFDDACERQIEDDLAEISRSTPAFSAVLRAYYRAQAAGDHATAQGLLGWLAGQPHTDRSLLKSAGLRGAVDGQAALSFLRGLLSLLPRAGYKGLVVVLDEVETIQRIPSNQRAKGLEALRQLMDMLGDDRLPGMYLIVTGTPAFFEGPKGIRELSPLYDRLKVRFDDDPTFDNLRAPQVRLPGFDAARLRRVGQAVRELYPATHPERLAATLSDPVLDALIADLTQRFGGEVSVVPRLFLRTLIDLADRADQHPDYDPMAHIRKVEVSPDALTDVERDAYERARLQQPAKPSPSAEAPPAEPPRRRRLED